MAFNNQGTLKKTTSDGVTRLDAVVTSMGLIDVRMGTLHLSRGPFLSDENGTLAGSGTIDLSNISITTQGEISPGNPLGALTLLGDLPQEATSAVNIEIGGTMPGVDYDQLHISNAATLRGTLNIQVVNDFLPANGTEFEILTFESSPGFFDSITGLVVTDGVFFEPIFGDTSLILKTIDTRPMIRFRTGHALPDGRALIQFEGTAGRNFFIESSVDFQGWDEVERVHDAGALYDFITADPSEFPFRFYRPIEFNVE